VLRIGREIAAKINHATVLQPNRTVGADTFAPATIDRHQPAFTDLAAGAAVR
jgi:hypothetical protein